MAKRVQQDDEWEEDSYGDPSDDEEGPGEHDRHLTDRHEPEVTVKCRSCGKRVWADVECCPKCGTFFADEAWNSEAAGDSKGRGLVPDWVWWTAIGLVAVILGYVLMFGRW